MFVAVALALSFSGASPILVHAGEEGVYAAKLREQALAADERFSGFRCEDAQVESIHREDVKIGDRHDVAAARERIMVSGCGRSNIENISVARLNGATPWLMAFGLPGESLAETSLQNTAFAQVISKVASSVSSGCTTTTLGDVYIAARPGRVAFTNAAAKRSASGFKFSVTLPDNVLSQQAALDFDAAWAEI